MAKTKTAPDDQLPEIAAPPVLSHDVADRFEYDVAFNLAFVGLGQAGGRIAESYWRMGYGRCGAINTCAEDLEGLDPEMPQLDLQTGGAGKDMRRGEAAVRNQAEACYELLTRAVGKQPDFLMVCAGLGGGTGSGGAAALVEIARRYMQEHDRPTSRVGAIVTLPHHAEGYAPCRNACRAFEQIYQLGVSPLIVIDNKRIGELFPAEAGVSKFYGNANVQVARLFHLFNRLAAQRSTIVTFDRADFATLLDAGLCVFGASGVARYANPADVSEAIRSHLAQTILAEVDFHTGTAAGCLFVGGGELLGKVPMDFFDGGFSMLTRLLAPGSVVHRGIYEGTAADLRCYTMVAGLKPPAARLRRLGAEGGLPAESLAQFLGVEDGQ